MQLKVNAILSIICQFFSQLKMQNFYAFKKNLHLLVQLHSLFGSVKFAKVKTTFQTILAVL